MNAVSDENSPHKCCIYSCLNNVGGVFGNDLVFIHCVCLFCSHQMMMENNSFFYLSEFFFRIIHLDVEMTAEK